MKSKLKLVTVGLVLNEGPIHIELPIERPTKRKKHSAPVVQKRDIPLPVIEPPPQEVGIGPGDLVSLFPAPPGPTSDLDYWRDAISDFGAYSDLSLDSDFSPSEDQMIF